MTVSGRLQLILWRIRLQLRKSGLLREVVRAIRSLAPDSRRRHLKLEVRFWRRWLATEGLHWHDDYLFRLDPRSALGEPLSLIVDRIRKDLKTVEILDVGAGPLTVLGKVHPSRTLAITATDVLGREYNALLDEFGVDPPVRTIAAEAEKLREQLGNRRFDITHAQNSLDHCADPVAGIEEMLALTRPGGFVVLLHEENEGSNELYFALHKWDFTTDGGRFIISGPGPDGPRRDISAMLSGRATVECSTFENELLVVMQKAAEA